MRIRNEQRYFSLFWLLLVLVLSLGTTLTSLAQEASLTGLTTDAVPTGIEVSASAIESATVTLPDGRLLVMVELTQPPAAVAFAQAGGISVEDAAMAIAQTQQFVIQAEQASVLSAAQASGIVLEVRSDTDFVMNSITVAIAPEYFDVLATLPGVKAIYPVTLIERDTSTSIPHIGAPSSWNGTFGGNYTGEGIVISIIDDGVDYTHRNMGGDGTWTTGPTNRTTLADAEPNFGSPTDKVIGGFDYVGDFFNGGAPPAGEVPALPVVITETPDADPISCSNIPSDMNSTFGQPIVTGPTGHGTHVSGIAAGIGVNADGTTFAGDYSAVPFSAMKIGPGAAPESQVIAMRVFGCYGSAFSSTIASAIDDSVSGTYSNGRRADIINMSLGSSFGTGADDPALTPYVVSIENATLAGTLVIASAGNSYDTYYTTGAPASVAWALSVSSSDDGNPAALQYNAPGLVTIQAAYGGGPGLTTLPLTGDIVPMIDVVEPADALPAGTTLDGCSTPTNAAALAGKIALADRGRCSFVIKAANAQAAGAIAIIIHNTSAGVFGTPGGVSQIPMVMVTFANGNTLRAAIAAAAIAAPPTTVTGSLSLALTTTVSPAITDTISVFSSRGPRRSDTAGGIKPDVSAPGNVIVSTGSGTGTGVNILGGTSMAAPTVAGVAALLLSNPVYADWTPMQLKALIMNTANNDIRITNVAGARISPQRMGSGRVDVIDAMSNSVIAYNAVAPHLVGVSFGNPEVPQGAIATYTKPVTFRNLGSTDATYDLSIDTYTNNNVSVFTVNPSSITVPAFGQINVDVTLTVTMTAAQPYNNGDASTATTVSSNVGTLPRHFLSEEGAILNATPTSGATINLRVQLYAAPRPSADMYAAVNPITLPSDVGTSVVQLAGTTVNTGGAQPFGIQSFVTALPLAYTDLVDQPSYSSAYDIEYVGIDSNFTEGGNSVGNVSPSTTVYFGIATADEWSTPAELSFRIYIDVDENGTTDFVAFTTAASWAGTTSAVDIFLTAVRRADQSSGPLHTFVNSLTAATNTYLLNNNVVMISILPGFLGNYDNNAVTPTTPMLGAGNTDFNYYVETFTGLLGTVDTTPVLSYDLANPEIHVTTGGASFAPVFFDQAGLIPFSYNITDDESTEPPPSILLMHHHNDDATQSGNSQNFKRAEVVALNLQEVDVGIYKTAPSEVAMGGLISFELEAVNFSAANVAQVEVTDELSTNVSFVSASALCTHDGSATGGVVTCTATIAPGAVELFTIDVALVGDFAGSIDNTATINLINAVDSDTSDQSSSTVTEVPLGIPTPLTPVGEQDVSYTTPDFTFTGTPYADWYQIWISGSDSDLPREGYFSWVDICDGTFEAQGTCTVSLGITLDPEGQYSWWVRGWKSNFTDAQWSSETQFYYPTGTPTLIAPTGSITDTTPDFSWNTVEGATWYRIWVSANGSYVHAQWYDQSSICSGDVCTTSIPPTLSGGAHTWWVQAWTYFGLEGEFSSGTDFYVTLDLGAPTLISPADEVIIYDDQTPDFSWNAVENATWYELYVETSAGVIQLDQWYDQSAVCTGGVCTVAAPATFPYGFYRFYVRAWAPVEGYSEWSSANDFRLHPPL